MGFLSPINIRYFGMFAYFVTRVVFPWVPCSLFSRPVSSELPEVPLIEEEVEETESWAKPLVHLWQTKSPNFAAEQEYNTAMARMEPHCAICALLMPYYKVMRGRRVIVKVSFHCCTCSVTVKTQGNHCKVNIHMKRKT